jgi:leader peptidase (prepilin peptidase)/N-methyltransferase
MLYPYYFIIGTIFGSFLNVVIYRIPKQISIIQPRSHCPKCKKLIPFYRNIPIISFLLQRGKCNQCNKSISFLYPLTEFTVGIIFLIGLHYFQNIESISFILVSSLLYAISIIDYKYYIIPIELSFFTLLALLPNIILSTNPLFYIYGLLVGLGYLLFIYIITRIITKKEPLGLGDIQLIALLGLWLGPFKILVTIFLSACIGIFYWIILYFIKGYEKNRKLPFGTFLSLSAIIIYLTKLI